MFQMHNIPQNDIPPNDIPQKSERFIRGRKGEDQATASLTASGFEIIARNFRSKFGEIDIIAVEKQLQIIVFFEVKAWSVFGIENLQYSLDLRKQRKIIKTAKYFLSENREYNKMGIRFDVIFVKDNKVFNEWQEADGYRITHLESAFTERVL